MRSTARYLLGAIALLLVVSLYALLGWLYARQLFDSAGALQASNAGENVQGLFAYHSALIALVTLLVGAVVAYMAYRHLGHIQRDRDASTTLAILQNYIENERLFKTRELVHAWKNELSQALQELVPPSEVNRLELDRRLRQISSDRLCLNDLVHLVMSMEHASLIIHHDFLSPQIRLLFDQMICRWWHLLGAFVQWERQARQPPQLKYGYHFEQLALELEEQNVKRAGPSKQPRNDTGGALRKRDYQMPWAVGAFFVIVLAVSIAVGYGLDQGAWYIRNRPDDYRSALAALGTAFAAVFTLLAALAAAFYVALTYGLWRETRRQVDASLDQLGILRQQVADAREKSKRDEQKDLREQIRELREIKPIVFTERVDDGRYSIVNVGSAPAMNVWYVATQEETPIPLGSLPAGDSRPVVNGVSIADRHLLIAEARPRVPRKWTPTMNRRESYGVCHGFIELQNDSLNYQGDIKGFLETKTPDLFVKLEEWDHLKADGTEAPTQDQIPTDSDSKTGPSAEN